MDCFFDCLEKKSQLYYYKKSEIFEFVGKVIESSKCNNKNVELCYYGKLDKNKYLSDFKLFNPKVVFMQGISHKYPFWVPDIANTTSIVHFAWGADGLNNLRKTKYRNIKLNVLRHAEDTNIFLKGTDVRSMYFGNFWSETLNCNPVGYEHLTNNSKSSNKILFMPESWLCTDNKKWSHKSCEKYISPVLDLAKKLGYEIIVKKREKGYPADKTCGFTNYIDLKPIDLIISKDLFFPFSIYGSILFVDKILLIGQLTQGTKSIIDFYKKHNFKHAHYENPANFNLESVSMFLTNSPDEENKSKIYKDASVKPSQKLLEYVNDNLC